LKRKFSKTFDSIVREKGLAPNSYSDTEIKSFENSLKTFPFFVNYVIKKMLGPKSAKRTGKYEKYIQQDWYTPSM
jgi:hypothetical protein